jgi:hypothetical protein
MKNTQHRVITLVDSLTIHHHLHVLDKTVNNRECLRCGYASLILGESIKPLEYRFDVLLSKELLDQFFCVSIESGSIILH